MNDFLQGFIKGAKETPIGFFAPAIAIWRVLSNVTESLTASDHQSVAKTLK